MKRNKIILILALLIIGIIFLTFKCLIDNEQILRVSLLGELTQKENSFVFSAPPGRFFQVFALYNQLEKMDNFNGKLILDVGDRHFTSLFNSQDVNQNFINVKNNLVAMEISDSNNFTEQVKEGNKYKITILCDEKFYQKDIKVKIYLYWVQKYKYRNTGKQEQFSM